MKKRIPIIIFLLILCAAIAGLAYFRYINSSPYLEKKAYRLIQEEDYAEALEVSYLSTSDEMKTLRYYANFLSANHEYLDVIEAGDAGADIPYLDIYSDAKFYLQPSSGDEHYSEISALFDKVKSVYLESAAVYKSEEAAKYTGGYPQDGMKVIYLEETVLGEPDMIWDGYHEGYYYEWYQDGTEIFYARVIDGYITDVEDYSYKLTEKNSSGDSSNSGSHSSSRSSSGNSYDDGYDDVWDNEDYDQDRYNSDADYANGVDDALDELGEDY